MGSLATTLTEEPAEGATRISPPEVETVRRTPGWTWNDFSTTRSILADAVAAAAQTSAQAMTTRLRQCMVGRGVSSNNTPTGQKLQVSIPSDGRPGAAKPPERPER